MVFHGGVDDGQDMVRVAARVRVMLTGRVRGDGRPVPRDLLAVIHEGLRML